MSESDEFPFAALAQYADAGPLKKQPQLPVEPTRPLALGDRVARLYADGILPLLVLLLAGLVLTTRQLPVMIGSFSLLLLPLLVWFAAPIAREPHGTRPTRLAAISLPLLGAGTLTYLLPALLDQQLRGIPIHVEFLAHTLQTQLESALQPWAFTAYLFLTGSLMALNSWLSRRFPWVDGLRVRRGALAWRYGVIVMACLGLAWVVHTLTAIHPEEEEWKQQAGALYQKLPLLRLPETAENTRWSSEPKELEARLEALIRDPQPVSSRQEWESAYRAVSEMSGGAELEALAQLGQSRLGLMARPAARAYPESILRDMLVPYLASADLSERQLDRWSERIRSLYGSLGPAATNLEATAYYALWAEPATLQSTRDLGWQLDRVYDVVLPGATNKVWVYNGRFRPSNLRLLGGSARWSPTWMADRWVRRRLTRRWLEERTRASELSVGEFVRHLKDLSYETVGAEQAFWSRMAAAAEASRDDREAVETAELVVALREYHSVVGRYPRSLDELKDEVSYPETLAGYTLTEAEGKSTLRVKGRHGDISLSGGTR